MSQVPSDIKNTEVAVEHELDTGDEAPRRGFIARFLYRVAPFALIAALWQTASLFSVPFLFPGLEKVSADVVKILTNWDMASQGLITLARVLGAVLISLIIGVPIGVAMGLSKRFDELVRPIVKFIMGIPALNWVIIVIIWFSSTELRIEFVLTMLCTPITIFCIYDGVRSVDHRLVDMVTSFGSNRYQLVRMLIWPYVKSFTFTAVKLNIGNAVRTVIVAELVGAPYGVGKELDLAKNVFDMSLVLAWTLVMVVMSLGLTHAVEMMEKASLRWRVGTQQ
jgi:NitT/TauT family transport system permease protein